MAATASKEGKSTLDPLLRSIVLLWLMIKDQEFSSFFFFFFFVSFAERKSLISTRSKDLRDKAGSPPREHILVSLGWVAGTRFASRPSIILLYQSLCWVESFFFTIGALRVRLLLNTTTMSENIVPVYILMSKENGDNVFGQNVDSVCCFFLVFSRRESFGDAIFLKFLHAIFRVRRDEATKNKQSNSKSQWDSPKMGFWDLEANSKRLNTTERGRAFNRRFNR